MTAPTPSAPPVASMVPSPTPSTLPGTSPAATVGTASPAPVVVVDDPGPDGVAIAGLVLSVVAFIAGIMTSVASIYLAWRAVQIGRTAAQEAEKANVEAGKARAAIAAERRRAFDLEVLQGLTEALDVELPRVLEIAVDPPKMRVYFGSRLALLPGHELPFWREVQAMTSHQDLEQRLAVTDGLGSGWVRATRDGRFQNHNQVTRAFSDRLLADLMTAIQERVEAHDA
ncbi:hypothetical protein [Actinoplanes subglobosus]|uniref:Uncharacterized protein n=1 Tax=Actinoplanes subglobosus TaxID=1547892 RepID=A0ABV8J6T3_9ACTN